MIDPRLARMLTVGGDVSPPTAAPSIRFRIRELIRKVVQR